VRDGDIAGEIELAESQPQFKHSRMNKPATWKELVAETLQKLGGEASLRDITEILKDNPRRPQTPTWNATIRRVVRQYKIFEPVKVDGLAGYRLVDLPEADPKAFHKKEDAHGEQQAMLLKLGTICGYETFTNSADKTIRQYGGEPISKFATIRNDTASLSALPMEKMKTTDVMWMTEDSEGLYPRYVFEVENSTGVKSGLVRLLKVPERYNARLFIIGPSPKEAELFRRYMSDSPFRRYADRIRFHFFHEVLAFYQAGTAFDYHRETWAIGFAGN
jgi:hypothetical protein